MAYSKVSTIELINFMSFKKAKLAFDETGIINIKGYNDSGKSAILRALAVCLMDMWRSNQKKFIRHGEDYFRIAVSFDDGVTIVRDKYMNGQSLYELYKNGDRLFTTKQGNKLSKIDGVPKLIEDYLSLCVTDSVFLNYQSCVDKLPAVEYTGSENYQMFHEVLRMEEIFRANNMLNTDKNELGSRVAEIESEIQRNEILLERCGDVSEDFIAELSKLEEESIATEKKKEFLEGMLETADKFESIKEIPSIEKVSDSRLRRVHELSSVAESLGNIVQIPTINRVSGERLELLQSIENAVLSVEGFVSIPEIPKVSAEVIGKMGSLGNIMQAYKGYLDQRKVCKSIDGDLSSRKEELNDLMVEAKERGIDFVKCDNCGSYTVLGGEHAHESL